MYRLGVAVWLIALVALIVSCGDDEKPNADGAQILASSVVAVQKVQSFHFKLEHENGATAMPLNLELVSAEGDVMVPDRLAAEVRARASSISVRVDVVGIGNQTWITNPFSRRWQVLPGATLKDIADPAAIVGSLVQGLQDVKVAGHFDIEGVASYRLTGSMDSGVLKSAVPTAEPGHRVSVDLWIAEADWLPRRARVAGRLSAGEAENIVRLLDFSRFNAPINIQAPE